MAIALVDDSAVHRRSVRHILVRDGHAVVEFDNGALLLDAVEAEAESGVLNSQFDVIVLDYDMPGDDGLSVLARLARIDPACSVPVIMMTAHAEEVGVARALEAGACDYIAKPARLTELQARVHLASQLKRERDSARTQAFELARLTGDRDTAQAEDGPVILRLVLSGASRIRDDMVLGIAADLAAEHDVVLAPAGKRALVVSGADQAAAAFSDALAAALPEMALSVEQAAG